MHESNLDGLTATTARQIMRRFCIVLITLALVGCGDCVDVEDFVDAERPDLAGLPDTDPPDAGGDLTSDASRDSDRTPKDAEFQFDFGDPPDQGSEEFELHAIVPNSGPVSGGTRVRIEGSGFQEDSRVIFGQNDAEATLNAGVFVVQSPPSDSARSVTVKVIAPDGQTQAFVNGFTYIETLRVDSITPSRIPTTGGVEVEVRGAGFQPRTGVSFGRDSALRVQVVDETLMRVLAPPRARGLADLRVTTPDESLLVEDAVTYFEPLEIVEIEPASGYLAGGETVRISARGVSSEQRVFFGANEATISDFDINAGWIDAVAPPSASTGPVDVFVENATDAAVTTNGYTYRADDTPFIATINPVRGPLGGGTEVVLTGFGFDTPDTRIEFGGMEATIAANSATRARVVAPAGMGLGSVDVGLLHGGSVVALEPDGFEYVEDLEISSLQPDAGSSAGGEMVTIVGDGFTGVTRVDFGGVLADFSVVSDTEISVTTPTRTAGTVDVTVERGVVKAVADDAFTFVEDLEIWGFSPARGSIAGQTFVSVRGQGFSGALEAFLRGVEATDVRRIDRYNLSFRTPPNTSGPADLEVESDDGRKASGPYDFLYFDPASRFGGATGGPVDGAVNVTVFSLGGGPLADAFVMLSTRADTPYQGFTDANGMITLSGPDVFGAQTVTATAAGYSTATLQTMDAENITVFLNLLDPMGNPGPGQPRPLGTIHGRITATGKAASPDQEKSFDMAIVRTTQRTARSRNPNPGQQGIVLGEGNYEITTRIGDMSVVGLCGTYDEATQEFTPELLAVERFVFMSDQDRRRIDLDCSIPLDQSLTFKLRNTTFAPSGPNINRVRVLWDFGFEGIFASPAEGRDFSDLVTVEGQPATEGVLEDLKFIAIGGSYTGQGTPASETRLDQITSQPTPILMPELLDIAEPLSPMPGGTVQGNAIRFEASGPPYPDFWYVVLRNAMGIPFYEWILPGDQTRAVLPDFPDFSSLPAEIRPAPLAPGTYFGGFTGARVQSGYVYETWSYRDLGTENYSSYSVASWLIGLPF